MNLNQFYASLYKEGMSVNEISSFFGVSRYTVNGLLKYNGILKKGLGKDIEEEVANYLESQGKTVIRMKGDEAFDLLVDGDRIDVKSANACHNKNHNLLCYNFKLVHDLNPSKKYSECIDYFYLVFLDMPGKPIYSLSTGEVTTKRCIKIYESLHTKYPLKLVGYLKGGVK